MLTGGVKTGGKKPIVEKYRTRGDREEFSHTGRRHLNGAEMGYEADIGPRTNQGKPSLNHGFSPTFGPIISTSRFYGNIKFNLQKSGTLLLIRLPGRERSKPPCNLNHLVNSELDLEFAFPLSDKRTRKYRASLCMKSHSQQWKTLQVKVKGMIKQLSGVTHSPDDSSSDDSSHLVCRVSPDAFASINTN